jgi:hypothetical protein
MLTTLCPTCGGNPCANPHFCALCRQADAEAAKKTESANVLRCRRLLALPNHVSLEAIWHELNTVKERAAASTVESLVLGLRERGSKALEEPAVTRRLSELSDQQVIKVGNRLQQLKPEIARAWSAPEVEILFHARLKR